MENDSKEVDVVEILKLLFQNKKSVFKYLFVFTILGIFISLILPKEYTSKVVIVPQISKNKISSFSGLAAIAGFNLGSTGTDNIPLNLYPKIVESILFKKTLLKTKIFVPSLNKEVTYAEYYEKYEEFNFYNFLKKYTIGLPGVLLSNLKKDSIKKDKIALGSNLEIISHKESKLFKKIDEQLSVNYNEKEGYISLFFSMPQAIPSAQMAQKSQELLQQSIINFKSKKAKEKLLFLEARLKELTKNYNDKKIKLARYRDRNKSLITSLSQSRLENLQSEYNLAFNIYSELTKQQEAQKIKVKEDTPTFTVIDPVTVPLKKSKPKRVLVILTFALTGLIVSMSTLLIKKFIIPKFKI